ncbi:hypothetical protein [Acidithiobacillus thiooxidans]|uniref:Uncharacterized protein n=1 Tax=Acidithiobacillus thiooxidans ATCC 19377 TaxID=637390 RepID=A0A543PZZ8_ACITH|nr:hypothetical protein [Acidithiobacillus thiooxidans]MDX5936344.1 hypothetical protein [Acidithiobacillus thiooxidans]TQN49656.1 hypothetical protein DLNHIDIE_03065 [Acidithiobacillus thiooxidans ATCC 19377]
MRNSSGIGVFARWILLPWCGCIRHSVLKDGSRKIFLVRSLSPSDFVDCLATLSSDPPAFDLLISGHLSDQPRENRVARFGAESPDWRELLHGLAHPSQVHAIHALTRSTLMLQGSVQAMLLIYAGNDPVANRDVHMVAKQLVGNSVEIFK